MTAPPVQAREYNRFDITSHDFWSRPFTDRDDVFAQLRAADGLTWHHPFDSLFPMIMKVEVDLDRCTGHGICESIAEEVFEVADDSVVVIHDNERPESDRGRMQQAVTQCPVSALRLAD